MKYKILKGFRDKHTGERYKPGAVVEFSDERAKEINTVSTELIEKTAQKGRKKKSEQS